VNDHIVIVTGARTLAPEVVATIPDAAIVLGVDGGLDLALAAGLEPAGLVGVLDSVSSEGLSWARQHTTVAQHPTDKNSTDTELALAFAADMNPERLTMVGGGDRLDHTIAALGALTARNMAPIPVLDAWWDGQHVDVIHGPGRRRLALDVGTTLSLLAMRGPCDKVEISGVRWPLRDHRLESVFGLGVSNEVTHPDGIVDVSVSGGVLTVFDAPATPTESSAPA